MFLSLLTALVARPMTVVRTEAYPFRETPLVVAFAATEDLADVTEGACIPLASTPAISMHDAYLVLPLRACAELLAAFASGARGRVAQWFDAGVVVRAELLPGRWARLNVRRAWRAREVLDHGGRAVPATGDLAHDVNRLPFIAGFAPGGLLDRDGAAAVAGRDAYVGNARRNPHESDRYADLGEPTFVWSEHDGRGASVKVALAASEDDSLHALLAPLTVV